MFSMKAMDKGKEEDMHKRRPKRKERARIRGNRGNIHISKIPMEKRRMKTKFMMYHGTLAILIRKVNLLISPSILSLLSIVMKISA